MIKLRLADWSECFHVRFSENMDRVPYLWVGVAMKPFPVCGTWIGSTPNSWGYFVKRGNVRTNSSTCIKPQNPMFILLNKKLLGGWSNQNLLPQNMVHPSQIIQTRQYSEYTSFCAMASFPSVSA
eukprot:TRINITY_DN15196_c0_g1_i1.p1 TRINITY_DN15196_c0_g1~~TRINITY_DN15196_c0_g1_i1.p1  ORF type:complete len:125 (+),score=1.52 TRINITY_DN15196_c0_g1_i1:60-434(+)